jgi:hypothetical protein
VTEHLTGDESVGLDTGDPDRYRDRRGDERLTAGERPDLISVRVRPGITASLVDISRRGAALDTDRRLLPGRFVHVQFLIVSGGVTMRARVVRSVVAQLSAGRVVYRCAVQFDRPWEGTP